MKAIGVRELRQRASEHLRQVEAGATLTVTVRGRAVALLVPARRGGRRRTLVAQGRLVPGAGDLLAMGPPIAPSRGAPAPSDELRRARERER